MIPACHAEEPLKSLQTGGDWEVIVSLCSVVKAGYTLDRSPVHPRANAERQTRLLLFMFTEDQHFGACPGQLGCQTNMNWKLV